METLILVVAVVQAMGISLGVGSSTLAILNFFLAIKDGKIDETERHFMGITYMVLRIAMVIILFTTLFLTYIGYSNTGIEYFTTYVIAQLILITVLFTNAILMTMRIMPSTFGPALQASSWYTFGFLVSIYLNGLTSFSLLTFLLCYLAMFLIAVVVVNGVMAHIRSISTKTN